MSVWIPGGWVYDDWSDYQGWIDIDIDIEEPEFGWFATEAACQLECVRRNNEIAAEFDAKYASYVQQVADGNTAARNAYVIRAREYDALVAAGLRQPTEHRDPTPAIPDTREAWNKRRTPGKRWEPKEFKRNEEDK